MKGAGKGLSIQLRDAPMCALGVLFPVFVLALLALLTSKPLGNAISLGSRGVTEPILKVERYELG